MAPRYLAFGRWSHKGTESIGSLVVRRKRLLPQNHLRRELIDSRTTKNLAIYIKSTTDDFQGSHDPVPDTGRKLE
jgi:hypothetical protein